jgi:hypothetical protein
MIGLPDWYKSSRPLGDQTGRLPPLLETDHFHVASIAAPNRTREGFGPERQASHLIAVAMDDALLVSGFECRCDLSRHSQRFVERKRMTLREHVCERLALDQLHHQVIRADIVQRADIGMIQCSNGAGLAFEPFGEPLGRHLDRHVSSESVSRA